MLSGTSLAGTSFSSLLLPLHLISDQLLIYVRRALCVKAEPIISYESCVLGARGWFSKQGSRSPCGVFVSLVMEDLQTAALGGMMANSRGWDRRVEE